MARANQVFKHGTRTYQPGEELPPDVAAWATMVGFADDSAPAAPASVVLDIQDAAIGQNATNGG